MLGKCESPRCQQNKTDRILWWHSTELYWPEEVKNRDYYKACNKCVSADHTAWQNKELDKFKNKGYYITSG